LLKTTEFYFLFGWLSHDDCRDRNYRRFTGGYFPSRGALQLCMDVMDESNSILWRREDIHILRIGMFLSEPTSDSEHRQPPVEATSFLLLQEIPGLEASYRRIGIARILGPDVEGPDWKMKTVTIL
jgi:hypothetical protein